MDYSKLGGRRKDTSDLPTQKSKPSSSAGTGAVSKTTINAAEH